MQYIDLEGRFYRIVADDGSRFNPINFQIKYPNFKKMAKELNFQVRS
jgi:hypothetical protein